MATPKYKRVDWKIPQFDPTDRASNDQIDAWLYGVDGLMPDRDSLAGGGGGIGVAGPFTNSGIGVAGGTSCVGNAATYAANPQQQRPPYIMDTRAMLKAIGMRLRIHEAQELPFEFIFPHLFGETVFVFVIAKDEPVTLRDDAAMFPSDTLIAQLRLLMEAKV